MPRTRTHAGPRSAAVTRTAVRSAAAAATAVAIAVAVAAPASAQLPGVDLGTNVVIVDSTLVQVAVDAPNLTAGTVGLSLQNNTSSAITCSGIRGTDTGTTSRAGTVTTDEIVARTVDYYAQYPHTFDPALAIPVGSNGTNILTVGADLGSITTLIPGSLSGSLRPEFGATGRLSEMYTDARLDGLVGTIDTVTIPASSGITRTVALNEPAAGPRPSSFRPGALIACQISGQDYLFSGYFGDATPTIPLGSITSSETGRFGS
ncbi:hypothetical protein [Rhodococcus sp. IEGM 1408]|uniref:hypothetical protein n=1 Tax=Rhodococcus sp. IEGM 1408 TaxID=3082220 RepID=UPI002954D91D|nr:hypothetical protein [Rhodococcus sp. IEGM 1408]MDV8001823.1 hypothetical protein [Rhodococcus sp. IEGM 1408]